MPDSQRLGLVLTRRSWLERRWGHSHQSSFSHSIDVRDPLTPQDTRHVICNSMRGDVDGFYVSVITESNDRPPASICADRLCYNRVSFTARRRNAAPPPPTNSNGMALSATEIELVVKEIAPVLVQGRIQKISQPRDRVLLFECRVPGATHRLLISCEPETARLHLLGRPMQSPPSPPSFCQFLRAQIRGARFDDIQQLDHDRIVTFILSAREGPRTLVCELTGHT